MAIAVFFLQDIQLEHVTTQGKINPTASLFAVGSLETYSWAVKSLLNATLTLTSLTLQALIPYAPADLTTAVC